MLHPDHLHPVISDANLGTEWMNFWTEEHRKRIWSARRPWVLAGFAVVMFLLHWLAGPNWGGFIFAIIAVGFAGFHYFRRTGKSDLAAWEALKEQTLEVQAGQVYQEWQAKGKPKWVFPYLFFFPFVFVLINMRELSLEWTPRMSNDLVFGLIGSLLILLMVRIPARKEWERALALSRDILGLED